jgi:DNA-binding NtrC family response regulator
MSGPPPDRMLPTSGSRGTAPLANVPVLLASANGSDRSVVVSLLRGTRYLVVQAGSVRESAKILSHIVFPVMLYDASFDVAEWRLGLKRMISAWRVPSVLLIANRYDAEFTGDALRHGAFDILIRPLSFEAVVPALEFAYLHWKLALSRVDRPAIGSDRAPLDRRYGSGQSPE